jgi:hypothetical protein
MFGRRPRAAILRHTYPQQTNLIIVCGGALDRHSPLSSPRATGPEPGHEACSRLPKPSVFPVINDSYLITRQPGTSDAVSDVHQRLQVGHLPGGPSAGQHARRGSCLLHSQVCPAPHKWRRGQRQQVGQEKAEQARAGRSLKPPCALKRCCCCCCNPLMHFTAFAKEILSKGRAAVTAWQERESLCSAHVLAVPVWGIQRQGRLRQWTAERADEWSPCTAEWRGECAERAVPGFGLV